MTLEERVTRLEDIEAIRCLQARYQRCLDCRDFDGLAACFTDDVQSAYGNGDMSYNGKDAVVKFLCSVMTTDMPSAHLIHGGEIEVNGESATAKWYLEDFLIHRKYKMKIHGSAIYEVEYVKGQDGWHISKIGYQRGFEYMERQGLLNRITLKKMTFLDAVKAADAENLGDYGKYFKQLSDKTKKK